MTNFWKLQKWKYRYEGKLYYLINLLIILMAIYLASNRISHGSVLIRTGAKLRCAPFFAGLQTGFFITLRSRRSCVDQEVSTLSETRCGFVWKQGTPTVIYHHVPYHSGQKSEGVWCSYTVYIYIHWYIPLISLDTPTQKKGKHVEKKSPKDGGFHPEWGEDQPWKIHDISRETDRPKFGWWNPHDAKVPSIETDTSPSKRM